MKFKSMICIFVSFSFIFSSVVVGEFTVHKSERIFPIDAFEDSDGDGVPNWEDGCPFDPDKTDPGVCGCGVPDEDTNDNGIIDCLEDDNPPPPPPPPPDDGGWIGWSPWWVMVNAD